MAHSQAARTARPVRAAAALLLLLGLSSCARASIEDMGRNSIRDKADEAMETFTRITATIDAGDHSGLARSISQVLPVYEQGWDDNGDLFADLYFRDHLTTSGGFFGEQRTVNACVRYTSTTTGHTMTSIDCPTTGPQAEYADEHITIH